MLLALIGLLGLIVGYFTRELKEALKRIEAALKVLVQRKDKVEAEEIAKRKGMSFGDPMSLAELADMEEQERIDVINANM